MKYELEKYEPQEVPVLRIFGQKIYGSGNWQGYRYYRTVKWGKRYYSLDGGHTWHLSKEIALASSL